MTEFSNSFFLEDTKLKIINVTKDKEYLMINNVRNGKWKVSFKNDTYSIYHKNIEYKQNRLKPSKKTTSIEVTDFLLGVYSEKFYSDNVNDCKNVQVNKIMNYFYHKNFFEFNYLKNKSKWFLINYFSLYEQEKYNCLQGGFVLSLPIHTIITIVYFYEHGEIVKINITTKN